MRKRQLALGHLVLGDDLVLLQADIVVGELQLLVLVDEERVAAEAAAVGKQDPLGAPLGNLDFGGDAEGAVAHIHGVGRLHFARAREVDVLAARRRTFRGRGVAKRSTLRPSSGRTLYLLAMAHQSCFSSSSLAGFLAARSSDSEKSVSMLKSIHLSLSRSLAVMSLPNCHGAVGPPAVEIDGTLAEHLEVLGLARYLGLGIVEGRREAHPLDLALGDAVDGGGALHLQHVEHGRHQVDGVDELLANGVLGLDALGPMDDAQIRCAATGDFALPAAERRIGGVRPAPRIMRIGASDRPSWACASGSASTVSGTLLKNRFSLNEPFGPPSALAPLSDTG